MYRPTIGLEIHAELKTRTKMFCESANNPDETRPNLNVCPVCMAHPGTLPVINREAVKHILRIGTAVGGRLADFSEFDRKSYFYPDIPKGYQISQYINPLVTGGMLADVAITRVHLEEDTARSTHSHDKSLVDFNRAGIPLMELVTEPVIYDAKTAGIFARELQLLLRTLGASNANLEKGEMRIEANVSVAKHEARSTKSETNSKLGTKVEIKNLNSFRSVEKAIAYEIQRQTELLEKSGKVVQETRGWDEAKQETFHQRFKEGSADYRYFPEPDIPKIYVSEIPDFSKKALLKSLPELPWRRRERYVRAYLLKSADVKYLCATLERATFFDAVAAELSNDSKLLSLAANYIISDLAGIYAKMNGENYSALSSSAFAKLIWLISDGVLSSRGAKDTLQALVEHGGDPEAIARERGLIQIHDPDILNNSVDKVIAREIKAVSEYRNGKHTALQYLIGMAMRECKGAANPEIMRRIIETKIQSLK
jgi:aspartyl-tRNA(Asn)/glutamyl-tRNA(Gln) amidotransferase subunit B